MMVDLYKLLMPHEVETALQRLEADIPEEGADAQDSFVENESPAAVEAEEECTDVTLEEADPSGTGQADPELEAAAPAPEQTRDSMETTMTVHEDEDNGEEPEDPVAQEETAVPSRSYGLDEYARETGMDKAWLAKTFGLTTMKDRGGDTYLKLPYYTVDRSERNYRKRFANREKSWRHATKEKIGLYGEHLLPKAVNAGRVCIVDNEQDVHTLWYMGYPALALPPESDFSSEQVRKLQGLNIFILRRDDRWSEDFRERIIYGARRSGGMIIVYLTSCEGKTPAALVRQHGWEKAKEMLHEAFQAAERVESEAPSSKPVLQTDALPEGLVVPALWKCDEEGIWFYGRKEMEHVSYMPVILTKRLRDVGSREEKVEISFLRDGKWKSEVFPRSTIFTAKGIVALSDLGCAVTSENAKAMIRFLLDLEGENLDRIPVVESTSQFGWQAGAEKRFVPGLQRDLVLDIDPSLRSRADAYHHKGTREGWLEAIRPNRDNRLFRFLLAAGFAAPLIRITGERSFMVYLWADSRSGKTAALKASLSIWGSAMDLMVSFNATQVGLERTAAFCKDLPMGVDERQLAGKNQEGLERMVYMLSSGMGKTRGTKSGGVQATATWQTVIIATGEEPIVSEASQTGVATRVIELKGSPFGSETDARAMHELTGAHYGWAGPEFIGRIVEMGDAYIREKYQQMKAAVMEAAGDHCSSHVAGVSLIALADAITDTLLFAEDQEDVEGEWIHEASWSKALQMAADVMQELGNAEEMDVNTKALQFICDWINANKVAFMETATVQYGYEDGDMIYIIPTNIRNALEQTGYSYRKTMQFLAENGLIEKAGRSDHQGSNYTVTRRRDNRVSRYIGFKRYKAIREDKDKPSPEDNVISMTAKRDTTLPDGEDDFIEVNDQMSLALENPFV